MSVKLRDKLEINCKRTTSFLTEQDYRRHETADFKILLHTCIQSQKLCSVVEIFKVKETGHSLRNLYLLYLYLIP